ncbi:S9 family peptidase [Granulicella sp. L60]|uniref:alpha/beta hydrolase family protein n=1 Tax=Granulicella sp. L60 TaxID=1641866 RepID=UPI00131C2AE5|nr:alpha/beta hydrolase [Granulicella sp. L60]
MNLLRVLAIILVSLAIVQPRCVSQESTAKDLTSPSPVAGALDATSSQSVTHEPWDVLSTADMTLKPEPPIVGEKVSLPGFTRELLRVEWRKGDPIDLYVIRPVNVAHPPVVLYLYSFPSESERFLNNAFCRMLTKDGYAAVGFVSALTGPRYHDRPVKEWFISELQESLGTSVHDVQMVLNYLSTRGDLDMNRVGMFGQGSGGTIAILAGAADPRIKAIDVMDPWGDWPDFLAKSLIVPESERASYLKPEFLARVAPLDPVRWIPQLKTRPIRLQEALFNPLVPDSARKQIETAAPVGVELAQYRDTKEYSEKVSANGKMLDWLHTKLQPTTESLTAKALLQHAVVADKQEKAQ